MHDVPGQEDVAICECPNGEAANADSTPDCTGQGTWPDDPDGISEPLPNALRAAHPDVLGEPRALARLLCGLTSPRLSATKMTKESLFGALAETPFPEVLAWAESAGR